MASLRVQNDELARALRLVLLRGYIFLSQYDGSDAAAGAKAMREQLDEAHATLEKTQYTPKARVYRGVTIFPAEPNSAGMRWTARVKGDGLRADSLRGIKQLIRLHTVE